MSSPNTPAGEPAHCSQCESPIVVYESTEHGYRLVCACGDVGITINDTVANESLFTPISGRWSTIDSVDPWDGAFDPE